jgi:RNA polymerase sigma factor (sigma-70 family)
MVTKQIIYNFMILGFIKKISTSYSDDELVQQYKQGEDINVLGDLYQRYMDLVYGVCLKYLKVPDDAQDAVINIFEELITKVKKYDIDNFKSWLYQLAKNHCLMKLRSTKGKPVNVDVEVVHLAENMHLDDAVEKENNIIIMEACIEQLPAQQKKVVQMFYLSQQCYKEIADATATDINKVRSFIQNGRRNLKICMEKNAFQKAE